MSPSKKVPPIPADLLDWLEAQFPDRFPTGCPDMEELNRLQGSRKVVALLRRHFDSQNTTVLNR